MAETEAEKRRRALHLRKGGAPYDQIATTLGLDGPDEALVAVQAALEELPGESEAETMSLDEQRLEQLVLALWPRAMAGNGWAVERVVKVIELRLKLQDQRRSKQARPSTGALGKLRAVK